VEVGVSDARFWDVFRDPRWLLDSLLSRYKVIVVSTSSGWLTSNAGSGGIVARTNYFYARTGTTASSRGMGYDYTVGWNSGDIDRLSVDWTKRLEIHTTLARVNSDPECVARLQVKESSTEGPLAEPGVGVEIRNFDMYGEGFGSERGTVYLARLEPGRVARLRIVKYGDKLEFWVNNVLRGVLSGTHVPNAKGTRAGYIVLSIVNGPTGGVDASIIAGTITAIQEW